MTKHFLEAGMVRNDLQDLLEDARHLRHLLGMNVLARTEMVSSLAETGQFTTYEAELEKTAARLEEGAAALFDLMTQFPCEPLIYTGEGDTASVIELLEQLLAERRRSGRDCLPHAQTG